MLISILCSVLLLCSAAIISVLHFEKHRDVQPVHVAGFQPSEYKACDNGKSLKLTSEKSCDLVESGKLIHTQYKLLNENDFFSLVTSPVQRREIWFSRSEAGLTDKDGTVLYAKDAPELLLSRKITSYGNIASLDFKQTKLYPSDAAKLEKVMGREFRYTNPYTGKVSQPTMYYKRFAATDNTWTEKAQTGLPWPDEPPWRPGDIHCICLDYCRLLVRALDRNARPLTGSVPGRFFFVELKDGMNLTAGQLARSNATITAQKNPTPSTVYISSAPGLQMTVEVLRQLIPAVLWIFSLTMIGWLVRTAILAKAKHTIAHETKFKT